MEENPPPEKIINKKLNTILFMLCAVVVCVCLTAAVSGALFFVLVKVNLITGEEIFMPGLAVTFALSAAISFFIYNCLLRLAFRKIDIDEYFAPINFSLSKPQNDDVQTELD